MSRLDINDRAKRYGRFRYTGIDRRLVEVYATPVAVWAAIHDIGDEDAEDYLAAVLEGREGATIEASDADEAGLIEAILTATLRVDVDDADEITDRSKTVYRELAVAQILDTSETSGELRVLAAHGVKPDREQGVHGMFVHPATVCRKLLNGTPWAELNITDILNRAKGARVCNRRLAGRQAKGVWVPLPEDENDKDVPKQ